MYSLDYYEQTKGLLVDEDQHMGNLDETVAIDNPIVENPIVDEEESVNEVGLPQPTPPAVAIERTTSVATTSSWYVFLARCIPTYDICF